MKNDNQAALDLFSNYSDFMLTDEELLAIHGGATQSGSPGTNSGSDSGSSAAATSAPPPAPPPAAPPHTPTVQIHPVSTNVNVDVGQDATNELAGAARDLVNEVVHIVHDIHNSDTVQAIDNFVSTGINAATNALFGGSGGSGG